MIRLFRVSLPTSIVVLLLSEAMLLTFCYVVTAYWVLEVDPWTYLFFDGGLARILVVVLAILLGLHLLDLYAEIRTVSHTAQALEIVQAIGFAFIVEALLSYGNPNWRLPAE